MTPAGTPVVDDLARRRAKALGDPTRRRIFQRIAAAPDPTTVADLTGELGLNHNAIRQHLGKLRDAALVVERTRPAAGRGRPALVYEVPAEAVSAVDDPARYEELALLLLDVLRTGADPAEVGRIAAARRPPATRHDGPAGADPASRLAGELARQGFDPQPGDRADELVLRHCPFARAAIADADTVCRLHLGLAQGLADAVGLTVDDLVPAHPARGGCRLLFSSPPEASGGNR